jgi:prepilin peptidase CpaA
MIPAPSDAIVLMTVAAGSTAAAVIDLRTRRVPNALTLGIAAAGVVLAAGGAGRVGIAAAVGGCLAGLLLMLPGHLLGATGGGDVKLMGALGTLLGPAGTVTAFLVTAIAGGAIALVVAARRRRMTQTCGAVARLVATAGRVAPDIEHPSAGNRFAYAPAIAVGACAAACVAAIGWGGP